jgi:hypothetical protein
MQTRHLRPMEERSDEAPIRDTATTLASREPAPAGRRARATNSYSEEPVELITKQVQIEFKTNRYRVEGQNAF